ncbi:hypothetical protein J6590_027213 [Homalodisca vitripennis]|nr:hypothetical protein J6590_027213 [Homalodisca vitripennis]
MGCSVNHKKSSSLQEHLMVIEQVRQSFVNSPTKSTWHASHELSMDWLWYANCLAPAFPDLTLLDFFFWGFIKDMVYVPPLLATLPELRARIYAAAEQVTPAMLLRVW